MSTETVMRVVLDTNVLLDWLVFKDKNVLAISQAVESGRVHWFACPSMREELSRTLGYDNLQRWSPDREEVLTAFDRLAIPALQPATVLSLRCSDPDDQVFLDLAVAQSCHLLLSHDRALLRLARGASRLGLRIARPIDSALAC